MRNPSTTSIEIVIGTTSENATRPAMGTRTCRISSVAYADDDRLSEANTASAVGLPRRWCSSSSVCSGLPSNLRLRRYDSESGGNGTDGLGGRGPDGVRKPGGASTDTGLKVLQDARRRRLHPRPPRVGAALAPLAHCRELRGLPAPPPTPRVVVARRRLRARHHHCRPGPSGGAGTGGRHRRLPRRNRVFVVLHGEVLARA